VLDKWKVKEHTVVIQLSNVIIENPSSSSSGV